MSKSIIKIKKDIATKSLVKGKKVYDEKVKRFGKDEYRIWDPFKSKLGAALKKGLNIEETGIKENSKILYLGISTGTTASHISDIIGQKGIIYGIEFSSRSLIDLMKNTKDRKNIIPIMGDARIPEEYSPLIEKCDVLFVDVAQPDQSEIAVRNAKPLLKKKGVLLMAIKARSINVVRNPKDIFEEEVRKLSESFEIKKRINLHPFEKDHIFVVGIRK